MSNPHASWRVKKTGIRSKFKKKKKSVCKKNTNRDINMKSRGLIKVILKRKLRLWNIDF